MVRSEVSSFICVYTHTRASIICFVCHKILMALTQHLTLSSHTHFLRLCMPFDVKRFFPHLILLMTQRCARGTNSLLNVKPRQLIACFLGLVCYWRKSRQHAMIILCKHSLKGFRTHLLDALLFQVVILRYLFFGQLVSIRAQL
jgi:hypothetical protein